MESITGVKKLVSLPFKKLASSIRFIIKINNKNIPETKKIFLKIFLIDTVCEY